MSKTKKGRRHMPKQNPWTVTHPALRNKLTPYAIGPGATVDTALLNLFAEKGISLDTGVATTASAGSLAAAMATIPPGGKAEYGSITPAEDFVGPILKVLANAPGHQMKAKAVIKAVMAMMAGKLKSIDLEKLPNSPEIRAHNKINWARASMMPFRVNPKKPGLKPPPCAGYLDPKSGRGVWKLSAWGMKAAKTLK